MDLFRMVYHYCSSEVFFNIIQTKELWLTNSDTANDYLEKRWVRDGVSNVLRRLNTNPATEDFFYSFRQEYLSDSRPLYMSCFSEVIDSLSQWRGYANDGRGFAIGLHLNYFKVVEDDDEVV
jgi:hypothetical protein